MISDTISVNGTRLAYQIHGSEDGPVLLMIQGLGMTLSAWPPQLVQRFVETGYRVVVFDNRDAGRSETLEHLGAPAVVALYWRGLLGLPTSVPYRLDDMADDVLALMDALHIDSAHVVGISMGGMIAQLVAIKAGERVRSLTSWMSTTGDRHLEGPKWRVARLLMARPKGADMDARIQHSCRIWRAIGSPGFPTPEQQIIETVKRIYARGITVDGITRQTAAIIAAPGRSEALAEVTVPTLVLHGDADPLVPLSGGVATAKALPNAMLHVIKGLGHDLPLPLYDTFHRLISRHARSVE